MYPGLEALIGRSEFQLSRGEFFIAHGMRDSVADLFALPLLASFEALLNSWPDKIQVHLPDVADESSSITASAHDARKLFANGMGLLFDDAQQYATQLVPWLHAIRADLGLSSLTHERCLIYATPAGKGTAPHFDQNANFVLQISGTKTWSLAPNTNVVRPMTRHTINQPVEGELQSYAKLPMPTALPADHTQVTLEPGSVLFVPRGMWHATHAESDSLQLNFTFSAPTWIDLLTAALRSRLALSPEWRETAAPHAVETFEALLRELAADAAGWNATDILAATEA